MTNNHNNTILWLMACYLNILLISNVTSNKFIAVGEYGFDAGFMFFPFTYVINDIITENFGLKISRKIIFIGMCMNVFFGLALDFVVYLPFANTVSDIDYFACALSGSYRIFAASIVSYLFGELMNAHILMHLKTLWRSKMLWLRSCISITISASIETILFMYIAFGGILGHDQIWTIMSIQIPFKIIYIVFFIPLLYYFRKKLTKQKIDI